MSNSMFEQYGYKSARDLMADLARDISDGGELIAVTKNADSTVKQFGYRFDGGYWRIIYRNGSVSTIDCYDSDVELLFVMGV